MYYFIYWYVRDQEMFGLEKFRTQSDAENWLDTVGAQMANCYGSDYQFEVFHGSPVKCEPVEITVKHKLSL